MIILAVAVYVLIGLGFGFWVARDTYRNGNKEAYPRVEPGSVGHTWLTFIGFGVMWLPLVIVAGVATAFPSRAFRKLTETIFG